MGWGSGENYRGEIVGYAHRGFCDEPGCDTVIDRGLGYTCGGLEGVEGERGCGRHFCERHLSYLLLEDEDERIETYTRENGPLCPHCLDRVEKGLPTGMEDISWFTKEETA